MSVLSSPVDQECSGLEPPRSKNPVLAAVVMESPIAAMESGRPFVRAELGLAANPMTKTTNMMTAGTRRSDTGDTSLEAADPGGLLPARDMINHCVEYAERYSPYRQESTGRSSIGGWQRNRPTSRRLGHRRH